jgi:hypothetical protein
MFDDHILKILSRRGIARECIIDWEDLRQVYFTQYRSTKEGTRNVDGRAPSGGVRAPIMA